jgi:uncharacterized protein YndB with AHSA1/START domain
VIRGLRRLAVLAGIGVALAWVLDRVLRARIGGDQPPPFRSLMVIDAPIERVWAVLADVESQPRWMREMKAVRLLDPSPVGVGTRGEATVRVFGLAVTDPVTITEFEPPVRFAIRHEGTFAGQGVITLEAGADLTTTIVRWDETLVAPVIPFAWRAAAEPVFGHIFQADLEHLRDLVEAGG